MKTRHDFSETNAYGNSGYKDSNEKYSRSPTNRQASGRHVPQNRKRGRGVWGIVALIIIPVAFVLLTSVLAYTSIAPIARPVISIASMLVSDYELSAPPEARNLLELMQAPPQPIRIAVEQPAEPDTEEAVDIEEYVYRIPLSEIEMPNLGDQYGRITISGTNVDAPVFWSDEYPVLNRGVGTLHRRIPGAWLPGFGRTVMLAGHRNTDFLDLFSAEIGEYITIETHYGTFIYEIVHIEVFHMSSTDSFDFTREDENIIVYTCYPRDFVGRAIYRLFVYGNLVSGTQIDIDS